MTSTLHRANNKTRKNVFMFLLMAGVTLCVSCSQSPRSYSNSSEKIILFPDYTDLILPCNIAPLNFCLEGSSQKYRVELYGGQGEVRLEVQTDGEVRFSEKEWHRLLADNRGDSLFMDIYSHSSDGSWKKHPSYRYYVSNDSIDPYVHYRESASSYEFVSHLALVQRSTESFEREYHVKNNLLGRACINCHTFCDYDANRWMFHVRFQHPGTYLSSPEETRRIDTKIEGVPSVGTYAHYHPKGRYIAYSYNVVQPLLKGSLQHGRTEAIDSASDIYVYDIQKNLLFSAPDLHRKDRLESYPAWSPDGRYLYYTSAHVDDSLSPEGIANLYARYDLYRIAFDAEDGGWGTAECLLSSDSLGKSISIPRVSPDGKWVLFTAHHRGNFSIWYKDSDLFLYSVEGGDYFPLTLANDSLHAEGYHAWSSNGRWIAFSSKRIDGFFSRIHFAHVDSEGKVSKAFVLPEKDPRKYKHYVYSNSIPEFTRNAQDASVYRNARLTELPLVQAESETQALSGATSSTP